MAQRVLWDINEAVILLDALTSVQERRMTRNEAIISVSSELRTRAAKCGIEIDEAFRNINGITLQMSKMEYILTEGRQGMRNSSMPKPFHEAVDLYRHNRKAYEKVLREAKSMPNAKSIQDTYFAWLASQVSPAQLSELYVVYADIEDFCLNRKIISKKIFELNNLADIRKVLSAVESNRVFRFTYKRSLSKMSSAMRFYYRFMKENYDMFAQSEPTQKKEKPETLTTESTSAMALSKAGRERSTESNADKVVDFTANESVAFTQPTEFSYFGEHQAKVSSWTQLYVQIVICLLEDYPGTLKSYLNSNISGQGRYDFADETGVGTMTAPKRVENGFYLETNISATDILKKIRRLLDLCNVDYENLTVHYQGKNGTASNIIPAQQMEGSETDKADVSKHRIRFIEWMKQSGASTGTIFSYLSAIGQSSKVSIEYGICDTDLLLIQNANRLEEIKTLLLNIPVFQENDAQQHNRFRAALAKLVAFRSAMPTQLQSVEEGATGNKENLVFKLLDKHRVRYVDQRRKGGCLWIIGGHELDSIVDQCHRLGIHFKYKAEGSRSTGGQQAWWSKNILEVVVPQMTPVQSQPDVNVPAINDVERHSISATLPEKQRSRYTEILSECFGEDGYQLGRAIFQGRFKRYYAEKFGCDPEEPDERIDDIISIVGTKRGDRIFPKQDEHQNDLIANIIADIMAAFEEGATAVYVEAIFDKYQKVLADGLQVYNQDALSVLLMAQANGRYIQRYAYLTTGLGEVNPAADLLRIMKAFHQPQDYAAIYEKAWFIPYAKMKSLLVSERSIVNVASETYFYAPNLPISAEELAQLTTQIREELNHHSHITDVKLMRLIQEKCPTIAINTDGYTTYGLRNCLGYILQDQFAFNGPIISLKGKELSMGDVYAEFSREHEVLQLDDLTSLSAEMNIGIYWDSVLSEMIRVSATEFVRKDFINFDVNAVDAILDGMCQGDYTPIKDVALFLHFPNVGYPWNSYLLESYLFSCSRKFHLLHSSFIKTGVYGAMVRVDSGIHDYRSLLLDVLSKSDALGSAKAALQYIVDQGYQQRRRYEGIEMLIQEAKLIKEQRERQEK